MREEELICIKCPVGCRLAVKAEGENITVSGHSCGQGREYGRQEVLAPERTVTCLMRLSNRAVPLSVKTDKPVPKGKVCECVREIYRLKPAAPVRAGEVMIRNVCGTSADVVATRTIE